MCQCLCTLSVDTNLCSPLVLASSRVFRLLLPDRTTHLAMATATTATAHIHKRLRASLRQRQIVLVAVTAVLVATVTVGIGMLAMDKAPSFHHWSPTFLIHRMVRTAQQDEEGLHPISVQPKLPPISIKSSPGFYLFTWSSMSIVLNITIETLDCSDLRVPL